MFQRNVLSMLVAATVGLGASGAAFAKLSDDVVARGSVEAAGTAAGRTDAVDRIAREAGEGPRREDRRQDRRGAAQDDVGQQPLAREGGVRRSRGRDGVKEEVTEQIAREGGVRRSRGRDGLQDDEVVQIIAREAGEAPRGRDNERPGDRQRGRGGRNA